MGATIDDKVVAMSFENSKFESGVKTTISSIDRLKQSLNFTGVGKSFDALNTSVNRTNFRPLSRSIDSVKAHFSAANVIMGAALGHLTIQAVNFAERFSKAITIGPILQGLDIYQTKLQAIQTILANTQAAGTKMSDVTKALNELNVYSNKTIYSFGEMTKNIGTFTAAGVGLKPAVSAIKGIANLAALSGSNSQQASTAMYQLSQAIAAGRVSLQDWNSVVNAGLGGSVFQRALVQTAVAMGKLKDSSVKLVGPMKNVQIAGQSFRQSIQGGLGRPSWLSSDVLTKTLGTFTGDLTNAQLAAEGFNKQQIKNIQQTAKTALNAATQVKTFSQLADVTKETIATGWSQSFELIIGNLNEAKKLFTDISNTLSNVITNSANTRNKILGDWKNLGGRTVLIKALGEVFKSLGAVLKPIRDAFRDIFPRKSGQQLYDLTLRFKKFADTLRPSQDTIDNLRRTFRGIFALLDIGKQIIGGAIEVFAKLFGVVFGGKRSFLGLTANIGDFLVSVDLALKKGNALKKFFNGLGNVLVIPINLFKEIAHAVANMFHGFSPGGFSNKMDLATKAARPFKNALNVIISALQGLGPAIHAAVQNMNFELILEVIRTGLFAGLVLLIRKFIGGTTLEKVLGIFGDKLGKGLGAKIGGGLLKNISGTFGQLTGTLKTMQQNLKAKTLEEIAIAIALISASVVALSLVKPKRLNSALTAMAIGFGELIGAMVLMDKLTGAKSIVKLPIIAASLVLLATAIDLLTVAVYALSKLSPKELIKGLGAIATILGTLAVATKVLSKNAVGMAIAGAALNEVAVALNIIALAVKQFAKMDIVSLGKGLLGVAGSLTGIAIAMRLMPKSIIVTAGGVVIIALALNILAKAMAKFGAMNLHVIGKGLLGIGGGLAVIALAMKLMPKSVLFTAAGLFIVAEALGKIVSAVSSMGAMSIHKLATGLISLAAALGILAVSLHAMAGTLAGAAALGIAASGLSLLIPALIALGRQSWSTIIKSLVSFGAAIGVIAVAANVLSGSIPALIGFGAALVVIGAGLALAGAGVALFGIGLSAIAVSGSAAIGVLIAGLIDLSEALPKFVKNLILGLLEAVKTFSEVAPQFVKALIKIVDSFSKVIEKSAPRLAEAFVVLLTKALEALDKHSPEIIKAGFDILEKLLQGISDNIGEVVTIAATIVINLVDSLAKNADRLITAGFHLIISIITGITSNIGKLINAGAHIIANFITGIGNNIDKVIKAGANIIVNLLAGMGNNLSRIAVTGGKAIAQFITGLGTAGKAIITAGTNTIIKLIDALTANNIRLTNAGFRALIRFLNGIADAIDKHEPELIQAGVRIGQAIVTGMIKGFAGLAPSFLNKAKDLASSGLHKIGSIFGIHSPSRETYKIGRYVVQGLINGIEDTNSKANAAVENLSNSLLNTMNNISFDDLLHTEPKITPILDLSSIKNKAGELSGIINKTPLGAISLNHASVISAKQALASVGTDPTQPISTGPSIKFEQKNFSPRELPASEIYRNTRNQLSQLKAIVEGA